jgi:zinc and cadmium transporter
MKIPLLLTLYCVLITAASLLGGSLPRLLRMTHLRTQLIISFVAGLMLSIATYQLLPHAIVLLGSASLTGGAVLGGVVAMFLMLRAFHVHAHVGSPLRVDAEDDLPHVGCEHDHGPSSDPPDAHPRETPESSVVSAEGRATSHSATAGGGFTWVGMLLGLGVHSLMDGVALASSVAADAGQGAWLGLFGFGTFLAIALHKPLDAFAITSTMQAAGWREDQRGAVNLLYSLLSPAGVILFWVGASRLGMGEWVIGLALAVSAGFFICIALADLLPEVHFHSHDRLKLTAVFLLGVGLAIVVENLPGHRHDHEHDHTAPAAAAELEDRS